VWGEHIAVDKSSLEKEIINLEKSIFENSSKSLKRYLQIIPTINQTVIGNDMEQLQKYVDLYQDSKSVILGTVPNKVWDKKFKMRLRSKNTGKVLEFYFKFKYEK
jgi:predicted solute-binding protein